jgi:hypothetical protein
MTVKNRFLTIGAFLLIVSTQSFAQPSASGQQNGAQYNTITTAVPFMTISPDARSGGMGDVGIAISPDANAQYWNQSKLAMAEEDAGVSLSYTPWLRDIVNDISLVYLAGYAKFGEKDNKNQAVSIGLRYFSLGDLNYTDIFGNRAGTGKPREFSIDAGYSRKLSENFSIGLSGKFIHSNIVNGAANTQGNYKPGNAGAVDFGAFYTKKLKENTETGQSSAFRLGGTIRNLGNKISYSGGRRDFLPTTLGIGGAYDYNIDEFNKITVAVDFTKLLVPTPQLDTNGNQIYNTSDGVISGIFKSFGDAPGGGSEEFQEINTSIGLEYSYQNQFFGRAGYFYENRYKGDRRFLTLGAGVKYSMFALNLAYLVPSGAGVNRNPLSNTLRFSLVFDVQDLNKMLLPNGKDSGSSNDKKDAKKDERKEKKDSK